MQNTFVKSLRQVEARIVKFEMQARRRRPRETRERKEGQGRYSMYVC
jgi:hypothetical protein